MQALFSVESYTLFNDNSKNEAVMGLVFSQEKEVPIPFSFKPSVNGMMDIHGSRYFSSIMNNVGSKVCSWYEWLRYCKVWNEKQHNSW